MGNNLGEEMDLTALLGNKKVAKKKDTTDIDETKDNNKYNERMKKLTSGQIDPEQAKIDKYRKSKRVQFIFSVPEVLKMEFLDQAIKEGFYRIRNGHKEADQKKYLYHVLRQAGMKIPDYDKLDSRRL